MRSKLDGVDAGAWGDTCGQGQTSAVQCWRIKIRDLDEEKEEGKTHGLLVGISGQQVGDRKEAEQKRLGKS